MKEAPTLHHREWQDGVEACVQREWRGGCGSGVSEGEWGRVTGPAPTHQPCGRLTGEIRLWWRLIIWGLTAGASLLAQAQGGMQHHHTRRGRRHATRYYIQITTNKTLSNIFVCSYDQGLVTAKLPLQWRRKHCTALSIRPSNSKIYYVGLCKKWHKVKECKNQTFLELLNGRMWDPI